MDKVIRIACEGADAIDYENLVPAQGELKSLSELNYERLKAEIIEHGFSEPVLVWKEQNKICNGHQRLRTVKTMVEKEGYAVEPIPVSYVTAKDENELAKKILAMASVYGTVEKEGLYEFMNEWDISIEELALRYDLPELNLDRFASEFFKDLDESDLDDDEIETANPEEPLPEDIPTHQVRMGQLFFSDVSHESFRSMIEDLKEHYTTTNVTDTVLAAVKEAHIARAEA